MRKTALSFILLFLMTLSGCARLTLMASSDITTNLAKARESENFTLAWYYLNNIKESSAEYEHIASQHDALSKQTAVFESTNISRAQKLASAGRWQEAFETLTVAQQKWRNSEKLDAAEQGLRTRETLLFNRLRTDLLVNEARWLAAEQNTLTEMATLEQEDALALTAKMNERKSALIRTLNELGESFAKSDDWVRTRDLLSASRALSGSVEVTESLTTAQRHLANEQNRHKRVQEKKIQNKALSLLDNYETSLSLADLLNAREYISQNNRSGQLDQHAARLEAICQKRFNQGLNDGDALYTQGRYQEALQTWQNIRDIYPGNAELDKKMERATRVISNLKALSS